MGRAQRQRFLIALSPWLFAERADRQEQPPRKRFVMANAGAIALGGVAAAYSRGASGRAGVGVLCGRFPGCEPDKLGACVTPIRSVPAVR